MTAASEVRAAGAGAELPEWLGRGFGWLSNPLATKELISRMRGPRTFVIAMLMLLPLAAVGAGIYAMIASAPSGEFSTSTPVGKVYFAAVTALELGLICLLAPALTADLISGERERQTLDLLLVTPLSRRQIVVGKLVAALGSLYLLVILALPIQAVAVLIGGVGWEELAVGMTMLFLTATTYGCVGLYWSARMRSTRAAILLAYVATILGVGGLPFCLLLLIIGSGIFGARVETELWPLVWLLNGPQTVSNRLGPTDGDVFGGGVLLQFEAILGQLVMATNPLIAGITSASTLVRGRPIFSLDEIAGVDVLYVAPWLLFGIVHVLASVLLIWLTARALRRASR